MNWNHDLSQAPRGKMVPYTRKGKDGPVQSEQYRKEYILAVDVHGDVYQSYWIPPRYTQTGALLEGNRWSGFNPGVDPIAWAPWPEYKFQEPQRQQGTDGGEIAVAYIQLDKGKVAVVDAADAEVLSGSTWFAVERGKTFYAARSPLGKMEYMHRVIIGASDDQLVDHENRDGLDNRRANIRISTAGENAANADLRSDNTSGFKGVYASGNRWTARIKVDGKKVYLGSFDTAQQAADAYDNAAIEAFGEFALLNRTIQARLANAAGVEPSPSDHFILEDVGGGA